MLKNKDIFFLFTGWYPAPNSLGGTGFFSVLQYSKYFFLRLAGPTILITITLTGIAWLTQSLRFIDMIVNRGLDVRTFLYLSSLMLPSMLWIILPIALFISVLFVYHRLLSDSELVVMRSAGMSKLQIARPALWFALVITGISYVIGLYLLPASFREFKDMQSFIRDNYASLLLQEGVFSAPVKGLTVYIRERDDNDMLRGMMVHDSRKEGTSVTMMAEEGQLVQSPTGPRFLLLNGNRQEVNRKTGELSLLYFERYALDLNLFITAVNNKRWREPKERYLTELWNDPETPEHLQPVLNAEGHNRLSWPFYSFLMAMVALTAILNGRANRIGYGRTVFNGVIVAVLLLAWSLGLQSLMVRHHYAIWVHHGGLLIAFIIGFGMLKEYPKRRRCMQYAP